jgi:hypothetical protein
VELSFDPSIRELIFQEGVFPNQGTRPVLTTIYQLVGSKMGNFGTRIITEGVQVDSIRLSRLGDRMKVCYLKNDIEQFSYEEKLILRLTELRKNKKDDHQAISAVHESGHAILSVILLNTLPEVVHSTTADASAEGFVFTHYPWKYIAKNQMLLRAACYLGGIEAEKIVFGENHITNGSENDIREATFLLSSMLKESGMGEIVGSFHIPCEGTNYNLYDPDQKVNKTLGKLLKEASALANKTLQKEQVLLLHLANFLSDNISINKVKIREFVETFASSYKTENLVEKGDNLYYRRRLKLKFHELNEEQNIPCSKTLILNRNLQINS